MRGTYDNLDRIRLVQSKAKFSRNNPSLDDSGTVPLSAIKSEDLGDDGFPQKCPEHTSRECSCTSSASSHPLVPTASHPQASVPSTFNNLLQQNPRAPVFYGRDLKHMRIFNQEVDEAVHRRFREVHEQLEPVLLNFMSKERIAYRSTGIRLLVLGATEDEAKPWIIVHCPHSARKKTRKFLKKDLIMSICQGSSSCQIKFDLAVCPSLEKSDSEDPDEVFIEEDDSRTPEARIPQIKIIQSGTARYATMGGFVSVTVAHEKKLVYGLTAGHIVPTEDLDDKDVCMSLSEDSEDDESDDERDNDSNSSSFDHKPVCFSLNAESRPSLRDSFAVGDEGLNDKHRHSWANLGQMSRVSYSTRAQDHDWALIELTTTQTERLNVPKALSSAPLDAARPSDDHRALIWNKSMIECTISSLPARAILPSGNRFVDVDVLYPDDNEALPKGSSGSWVVDADRKKIYGVLIATDCFGGLWMARMTDILKDIQDEFNTMEVAFLSHVSAMDVDQGTKTQSEVPEELDTLDNRKKSTSLPSDIAAPTFTSTTQETEDPLDEQSQNQHASATECQRCGSTTHIGQCPDPSDHIRSEAEYSKQKPTVTSSTAHAGINAASTSASFYPIVGGISGKGMIWVCSECGDGPYGLWQPSCQACAHRLCSSCKTEFAY